MSAVRPGVAHRVNPHAGRNGVAVAVAEYYPIARKMAWGDDDLQQELMLSVMDSVGTRKIPDKGLIINRMVLQRKMYWQGYLFADRFGKSIDNGCASRREGVTIIPYESAAGTDTGQSDPDFAIYFTDYRNPEETALFNVGYERFLDDLTVVERGFWDVKLKGGTWVDVERLKIADRNHQPALKRRIREKFRKWFGE